MKFLLDSNLSHRVAQLLRDASIDAAHVRDHDLQHATDSVILEFARRHAFVLVSEDTDFGELLARQSAGAPSFVLFAHLRTHDPERPGRCSGGEPSPALRRP
jgi:predicted nuclease of predicted toxin-antitoxin system